MITLWWTRRSIAAAVVIASFHIPELQLSLSKNAVLTLNRHSWQTVLLIVAKQLTAYDIMQFTYEMQQFRAKIFRG